MFVRFVIFFCLIQSGNGITSPVAPFTTYSHSVQLQTNVADLWWTVDDRNQTILFELHIKTTGWIALGISPGIEFFRSIGHFYFEKCFLFVQLEAWPVLILELDGLIKVDESIFKYISRHYRTNRSNLIF